MLAALGMLPAPVWRWLAIGAAFVAALGFGYVKGIGHQQLVDEAAAAEIEQAREAASARQAAALRPIATQFTEDHAHEAEQQPAVAAGIAAYLDRPVPAGQCLRDHAAEAPARVPQLRSGAAGAAASPGADRGRPQAPVDAALNARIAHDASLYRQCATQLDALIRTAIAAGADKP